MVVSSFRCMVMSSLRDWYLKPPRDARAGRVVDRKRGAPAAWPLPVCEQWTCFLIHMPLGEQGRSRPLPDYCQVTDSSARPAPQFDRPAAAASGVGPLPQSPASAVEPLRSS